MRILILKSNHLLVICIVARKKKLSTISIYNQSCGCGWSGD
jgi:hypothetical protein